MGKTKRELYEEVWENHVKTLTKLGWNLPEKADRDKVKSLQARLMVLVERASLEVKDERP